MHVHEAADHIPQSRPHGDGAEEHRHHTGALIGRKIVGQQARGDGAVAASPTPTDARAASSAPKLPANPAGCATLQQATPKAIKRGAQTGRPGPEHRRGQV